MKRCRIGIIGAGRIGKLHAENISNRLPHFELAGIADPHLDIKWAQQLRIPLQSNFAADLIEHPDIDAILIASPSTLHTDQVVAASNAGKAIFCEKPLGLTIDAIEKVINIVDKNKTLLQIGFNRRFDPTFARIQKQVQNGDVGRMHLLKITSRDPACPTKEYCSTSGGLFMDMAIHDFDMARFLTGSDVTEVYAAGAVLINPDFAEFNDVDTAIIYLRFENGALCVIDNSRQAVYGYDQRVEVFGERGSLQANNQPQHGVVHLDQTGTKHANPLYFFLERYQSAYIAEMEAFYHAWLENKSSPVSAHDGLQALRIAMAAKHSLESNQPYVMTKLCA
jgi:myo-inositol 2-dehydrogenase/D-chiro-inositol 1-dehydrogenase